MICNGNIFEMKVQSVSLPILEKARIEVLKGHCPAAGLITPGSVYFKCAVPEGIETVKLCLANGSYMEIFENQITLLIESETTIKCSSEFS